MIHQCPCGFATDDQLWFESHQAQHVLDGQDDTKRDHDVSGMAAAELERARRDLLVSLSLAFPGSPVRVPILAQMSAINAELAARVGGPSAGPTGASLSPSTLEELWRAISADNTAKPVPRSTVVRCILTRAGRRDRARGLRQAVAQ